MLHDQLHCLQAYSCGFDELHPCDRPQRQLEQGRSQGPQVQQPLLLHSYPLLLLLLVVLVFTVVLLLCCCAAAMLKYVDTQLHQHAAL
jgi:hypothetical protein